MHRGDYHLIMFRFAIKQGVEVRMSTTVTDYDQAKPSIILSTGEEIEGDVVIVADGVKSIGRTTVLGCEDKPLHSGYAIYRSFVDADAVSDDPLIAKFLRDGDSLRLFLAPDMHGFITTLRNGKEINAVLTHKDVGDFEEG